MRNVIRGVWQYFAWGTSWALCYAGAPTGVRRWWLLTAGICAK